MIEGMLEFPLGGADGSPPLHLPGGAAQAYRDQVIALSTGEKNAIRYQYWGRLSHRKFCLPQNVL
jgi:hypothetical protein